MEETEFKREFNKGRGNSKQGFKKKGPGKIFHKTKTYNADDRFSVTGFCVGREGPELYMKTVQEWSGCEELPEKGSYG